MKWHLVYVPKLVWFGRLVCSTIFLMRWVVPQNSTSRPLQIRHLIRHLIRQRSFGSQQGCSEQDDAGSCRSIMQRIFGQDRARL